MMGIIKPVGADGIGNAGNKGPQMHKTQVAQMAVDEFLASGERACEVDWKRIDEDFDIAKHALSYRISHTKSNAAGGAADDMAMRSNRRSSKIYLVHTDGA